MSANYRVFIRNWYRREGGRIVPGPGRKSFAGHPQRVTAEQARAYCEEWNSTHKPGPLSRKAEFEAR